MKNAEAIRRRLDEVKKMTSYTEALKALADIQYDIGVEACNERKLLREEVEKLRSIILGNGNQDKSLLHRIGVLERCVNENSESTNKSLEKIENALLGSDQQEGIYEKIRSIEKMKANIDRVMWVIISAVIGQLILILIGIL